MATKITLNENHIMEVDGKPLFPIAARHIPLGADFRLLSEIGFNATRWTPFGMQNFEQSGYQAPSARDLGSLMFYAYVYNRGDLSKDAERRTQELTDLVRCVQDHPNLLCYEQLNEPAYTAMDHQRAQGSAEGMIAGSKVIRSLDSKHPIRVGHMCCNLVSTLRKYNPAVEIVSANPYVIRAPGARRFVGFRSDGYLTDHSDRELSVVGRYTDKMKRVAEDGGKAVWMQLQASSNENWYSPEHTPELRDQGVYEHQRCYPTYWQMRFMAFNAIIHGATGLEWMLIRHPVDSPSFLDVKKVIGELRDLHDVLASPPMAHDFQIEYTELGFSDWEGVETLVKINKGKAYILAANAQFDPMIATFTRVPSGVGKRLQVVGENRQIAIGSSGFTDRFQPYEVHVYSPD